MNLMKAAPGRLDALKAMMGGSEAQGPSQEDVLGPEDGSGDSGAEMAPPDASQGGGDVEQQMNDVMDQLSTASSTLDGINPDDQQDQETLTEAKAHLNHAIKLIQSTAHQEASEGPTDDDNEKDPTEGDERGEMNQRDAEL